MANLTSTYISPNSYVKLPKGTTAQRPGSPAAGMLRYNTDLRYTELYNGNSWVPFQASKALPNYATVTTSSGNHVVTHYLNNRIHSFLSGSHTFVPTVTGYVEVLVVAGGGAGGSAGGGGAGGLVYNNAFLVTAGASYTVTVGAGGLGFTSSTANVASNDGSASVFGSITAVGGGGGGAYGSANTNGRAGGSGGGAGHDTGVATTGGAGTSGQGFRGGNKPTFYGNNPYCAAGGGGAGGAGQDVATNNAAGAGGPGLPISILGIPLYWAGGGGGGVQGNTIAGIGGTGGLGGGGAGGNWNSGGSNWNQFGLGLQGALNPGKHGSNGSGSVTCRGGDAGPNTGGGGGGMGISVEISGNGGSGIVVVRYPSITPTPIIQQYTFDNAGIQRTYWTAPAGVSNVEVLVVAGGGGGGRYGGGGGAGGVVYNSSYAVTPGSSYQIQVGAGGSSWAGDAQSGGNAGTGGDSWFDVLRAFGGGGGGNYGNNACSNGAGGGSGGGGGCNNASGCAGGAGTQIQGNSGSAGSGSAYQGGGGGGAGQAGGTNGTSRGGDGVMYSITGLPLYYGGGGSGCSLQLLPGGLGGGGYGARESTYANVPYCDALPNTGGGGGGGRDALFFGTWRTGAGGSGVVILRYYQTTSY